jgi:CRISPR-associated protein Csm3
MKVIKMAIQFQANLLIKGVILCETGLHIGAQSEGIEIGGVDNIVIRDHITDLPYIPGSSLKGKTRTLLELNDKDASQNIIKNEGKPCKCGKCIPCKIFGRPAPEKKESEEIKEGLTGMQQGPTRLIVRDSFLTDKAIENLKDKETEVKQENTLDRITSEANPRPVERVPRGATFKFEMIFSVYDDEDYTNFQSVFQGMRLLEDSYLGGSGTRGYGQIKFKDIGITKRTAGYYKGTEKEIPINTGKTVPEILADINLVNLIKSG